MNSQGNLQTPILDEERPRTASPTTTRFAPTSHEVESGQGKVMILPWWQEIHRPLQDKESNRQALEAWASKLSSASNATHRVPLSTFLYRIDRWKPDVAVENYLQVRSRIII